MNRNLAPTLIFLHHQITHNDYEVLLPGIVPTASPNSTNTSTINSIENNQIRRHTQQQQYYHYYMNNELWTIRHRWKMTCQKNHSTTKTKPTKSNSTTKATRYETI